MWTGVCQLMFLFRFRTEESSKCLFSCTIEVKFVMIGIAPLRVSQTCWLADWLVGCIVWSDRLPGTAQLT